MVRRRLTWSLGVIAAGALAACGRADFDGAGGAGGASEASLAEARQGLVSSTVCLEIVRKGASGAVFDAELLLRTPERKLGGSLVFSTGVYAKDGLERRALLRFDLSAVPSGPNTNITGAGLYLVEGPAGTSGPGTVNVHRVTAPWSEATVTWQSFQDAFDPTILTSFSNASKAVNADLRALVSGWVQGAFPNDGLLLESQGGPVTNFWSSENPNVYFRPQLDLCYHVTCDPGWVDCNDDGSDGCEADVMSSAASCGACGQACTTSHGLPACVNGTCQVGSCDPGFGDCNGEPSDGCETPLPPNADCSGLCITGHTQSCYTGAPSTQGVGACRAGAQTCLQGLWGACAGEVKPSAEVCDGIDNDCDGAVDEGFGTLTCGVGQCARSVPACANGQAGACTPGAAQAETCNGLDDDCDGVVDDGDPGAGVACPTELAGVCAAGITACSGGALVCHPTTQATIEMCNNLDDNCNGAVDDGAAASCPAVAHGSSTCVSGTCGFACDAGYASCDGSAANGCETATAGDPANCGACGHVCAAADHATAACAGGACGYVCEAGYSDCDAASGCETRTVYDAVNCGGCGVQCSGAQRCFSGHCVDLSYTGVAVPGYRGGYLAQAYVIGASGSVYAWSGSAWTVVPSVSSAVEVSCGYGRCVALTRSNEVWAWGEFGCNSNYRVPQRIATGIAHVIAGVHVEMGVTVDGHLYWSGDRCYGTATPAQPSGIVRDVGVAIANHFCVLLDGGAIQCNTAVPANMPTDIVRLTGAWGGTFYAAAFYCAQRASGALVCWPPGGALSNVAGLGDGSQIGNQSATYAAAMTGVSAAHQAFGWTSAGGTPTRLFSTVSDVTQVSGLVYSDACIVRATGAVRCTFYQSGNADMPAVPTSP